MPTLLNYILAIRYFVSDMCSLFFFYLSTKFKLWVLALIGCGRLENVDGKTYELKYYHGATVYTLRLPKARGPPGVSAIFYNGKNVTSSMRSYMGPTNNFHGIAVTPAHLTGLKLPDGSLVNFDNPLYFFMMDGTTRGFNKNEVIDLSKNYA